MLESNSSRTPRSLEDLSSDEEEDGSSEPLPTIKSRKKIKIDAQDAKQSLKEVKKRPLERKVESEEEEVDDVKRYKLSTRDSPPPKESPKSSKKDIQSSRDTEEEKEEPRHSDDEDDQDDNQKTKSPKRLTLPLISEIVPESPVNESSPKRKDAQVISVEGLQHDKMKEKERVNDLLKDL